MRRGVLSQGSDLIQSIGWDNNEMEIKYAADGKVFRYFAVPFAVFKKIVRAKSPGHVWLAIRDKFKFEEV